MALQYAQILDWCIVSLVTRNVLGQLTQQATSHNETPSAASGTMYRLQKRICRQSDVHSLRRIVP